MSAIFLCDHTHTHSMHVTRIHQSVKNRNSVTHFLEQPLWTWVKLRFSSFYAFFTEKTELRDLATLELRGTGCTIFAFSFHCVYVHRFVLFIIFRQWLARKSDCRFLMGGGNRPVIMMGELKPLGQLLKLGALLQLIEGWLFVLLAYWTAWNLIHCCWSFEHKLNTVFDKNEQRSVSIEIVSWCR